MRFHLSIGCSGEAYRFPCFAPGVTGRTPMGTTVPDLRRYTFKLYPNRAQEAALERRRQLHSALYNGLIQQRIEAWQRGQWTLAHASAPRAKRGRTLTAFDQGKEVTALRAADPEYAALSRGEMEQTVKRVDLAFQAFFRRAKQGAGASAGFPRFKRCDGFGMREMSHGGWRFADNRLTVRGIPGRIKARGKFPAAPEEIRTCDLTLIGGVWWLSVVVVLPARMCAEASHCGEVAFDLIDAFARVRRTDGPYGAGPKETVFTAADGRIILSEQGACATSGADTPQAGGERGLAGGNHGPLRGADTPQAGGERGSSRGRRGCRAGADTPQAGGERGHERGGFDKIEALQRRMARCRRGSHKYRALRRQKARLQARQARQRREAMHAWTTMLVRRFAELQVRSPKIKETTATGRGDERDWGANVETKAAMNRRVLSQAPAAAIQMLQYKMAERGGAFAVIEDIAPKAAVGRDLVESGKVLRKARRIVKKEAANV